MQDDLTYWQQWQMKNYGNILPEEESDEDFIRQQKELDFDEDINNFFEE